MLQVRDCVCSVMKNRGGKRGIGMLQNLGEVLRLARAARSDYRNRRGLADGPRQRAIEAGLYTVGVHGCQQYFARAKLLASSRPFDCVNTFIVPAATGVDVPATT